METFLGPFRVVVATEGHPARGPEEAAVTLVTFSDFECAACWRLTQTLERVLEVHAEDVRLVFRQLPAAERESPTQAAEASLCAHEQGLFWAAHDLLFGQEPGPAAERLLSRAARVGLESESFRRCVEDRRYAARVRDDAAAAVEAGAATAPVVFVNGRLLTGAVPYERLAGLVEDELARAGESR